MLQTRRLDSFYQGETWREDIEIVDQYSNPIDLTGSTFTMTLTAIDTPQGVGYRFNRDYYDDCGSISLQGSTAGGEISIVGLGIIEWVFSSAQTASLRRGDYLGRLTAVRYDTTVVITPFEISVL